MLEVLSFFDWKETVMDCGKPLHHATAASYIEVLSFPISKHALTGKKLSWGLCKKLPHHTTPTYGIKLFQETEHFKGLGTTEKVSGVTARRK